MATTSRSPIPAWPEGVVSNEDKVAHCKRIRHAYPPGHREIDQIDAQIATLTKDPQ